MIANYRITLLGRKCWTDAPPLHLESSFVAVPLSRIDSSHVTDLDYQSERR